MLGGNPGAVLVLCCELLSFDNCSLLFIRVTKRRKKSAQNQLKSQAWTWITWLHNSSQALQNKVCKQGLMYLIIYLFI